MSNYFLLRSNPANVLDDDFGAPFVGVTFILDGAEAVEGCEEVDESSVSSDMVDNLEGLIFPFLSPASLAVS